MWQATKQTVVGRLSHLLDTGILSDVEFVVGKNMKSFSAHRLILCMSSSEFFRILNEQTSTLFGMEIISEPEVEPEAFEAVLKYIYTDVVDLNSATVMPTLFAAQKYHLPGLIRECENYFEKILSAKNAFQLLSHVKLFNQEHFIDTCLRTIDLDAKRAFQAEGFIDINKELLGLVLCRDTLDIEEIQLFEAAERWADAQCRRQLETVSTETKRAVLDDVFLLIRFPLMTAEDFARCKVWFTDSDWRIWQNPDTAGFPSNPRR